MRIRLRRNYSESFETRSLPVLARITLITRAARARASYLAALPSTRAIPDRGVFYVAHPIRSGRGQNFSCARARKRAAGWGAKTPRQSEATTTIY